MIRRGPTVAKMAAGLAALVGYGDTLGILTMISYMSDFGQVYSFSQGAMTNAIVSIIGSALVLTLAFVSGVAAGSLTGRWARDRRRQAVLSLVTLFFMIAALLHGVSGNGFALVAMVVALGALNAVLEDVPAVFVGLLELLGRFGERLATAVAGGRSRRLTADLPLLIGVIVGIAGGALLYPKFGLGSLWLAALAAGLLAAWSAIPNLNMKS